MSTGGTETQAVVILNESSGWDDKEAAFGLIRKIFLDCGWNCAIERVRAGMNIRQLASDAVARGAARVVAGGGDGTLRAVAAALAGTGVPMGILPVGTLNHFARDLEIPLDLEQAARIAAGTGVDVAVDLGDVNGQAFINNCVIGLYPAYRNQRDTRERVGWPKWPSIIAGAVTIFGRYPNLVLNFRANGVELTRRTAWVMIANNAHAMEGYKPWQRETLTGGDLWVYILKNRGRFALLRVFSKLLLGGTLAHEELEVMAASQLTLESRRKWIAISVDGEVFWLRSPLRFTSRQRELRVIVPSDSKRVAEAVCEVQGGRQFD